MDTLEVLKGTLLAATAIILTIGVCALCYYRRARSQPLIENLLA